jgi:parallel beta-helix repeat protein
MSLKPKFHKSTIRFIFVLCLLGGPILISFQIYEQDTRTTVQSSSPTESDDSLTLDPPPPLSYSYSPHDSIEITTDEDFTSANGVVSGSGISVDPFIIEGWNISSSGVHGISISGTTKFFLIRNNFIDTGGVYDIHGIYITNIVSGTAKIENNLCQNNWEGIYLASSSNNSLTNNNCSNNYYGIYLASSSNNSLTNNTCNSNNWDGIYLASSSNNSLTNNTCNSNYDYGIYLISSFNNSLTNNTCNSNNFGIYLDSSSNNSLTNNNCSNNGRGIRFSSSSNNSLTNNTCNSNYDYGIFIAGSNHNNSLTNNTCNSNYGYGIYLAGSNHNNSFTNNTCNSNYKDGIYLSGSNFNLLSWNLLFDNDYGVYLSSTSDNNILHHNTFIDNSNSPQAYDDGSNNQWFDTENNEGNYWSDYSGTGPQQIAGSSRSIDPYPLSEPTVVEFTILKGYFLALFTSFVLLCYLRRKNIKTN